MSSRANTSRRSTHASTSPQGKQAHPTRWYHYSDPRPSAVRWFYAGELPPTEIYGGKGGGKDASLRRR